MKPSIGRIVHYMLCEQDAEAINRRRDDTTKHRTEHIENATGAQVHVGNPVYEGDVFPMMITRVWGDDPNSCVQGQVFLDGNDTLWVTSVQVGSVPRTYAWPDRS